MRVLLFRAELIRPPGVAASEARRPRRSSRATRARVSPESLLSSDDNASDSGDDFRGSAPNPSERKRRTRGTGNARGRKRVRAERPAALPRAPVSTATGAKRPPARRGLRTLNAAQTRANLQIKDDNVLFNAVISPSTALQSTAEDWVMQYQTNVGLALSQLITCILRASACNETLDEDQAQDLDSVVDTLDDIQEIFKRDSPAAYPLISRAAQYKKFRPNLAELLRRIFTSAADADLLQDGTLLPALAAWLSAGSSSPIRSFRHTSTEAALLSVTSLLTIQADGRQECAKLTKQRDAEKAKARVNKSRLQEHESRLNDTTAMVVQISDFIKDMISGVYVHRYRDTDPSIRADCIHELGLWMAHDPENFLRPAYFTYLGLVIADEDVRVRVTAVNAMANLYGPYLRPAVRQFTQRFLPRLLEMARGDVDLAVRCRTLQLLSQINEHQVLGAQEQDEVAMQIFSAEPKIRTAVAPFVISVLLRNADHIKEAVIGRRIAQDGHGNWTEEDESFAIFKSFSQVLSQGAQIDTVIKPTPFVAHETSRVGFAIEALWEEASNLSNWPGVLDLILQGQPEEERAAVDGALADAEMSQRQQDGFAINRVQEATLLEAMPTMIAKAQEEAETNPEVAETAPDLGMILSAVPRLLSRHRTDSVVELRILSLVPYIPKARLAEGDDNSDRDALWSELHALLLRHKDPALLAKAAAGMERISTATSGAGVTGATDRMATLAEELIQHLRDAAAERDLETATLNDNDIYALQSTCARLQAVMGTHRGTDFFNAEADATPAWDILHALVSRGRLGYEEEALLVADALKTLEVYTLWLAKDATYEEERVGRIHTAVSSYLNLLQEYTRIGDTDANSRVMEAALEAVVSYLILREALVDNRDEAQDKDNPSTGATTQQILAKALRAALGSYEADDSIPANVQAVTNEAVEAFSVRHQNGAKQSQHEGSDAGSDQEDSDANTPVPETGEQNEDPQVVARKAELAHRACIGLGQLVRLAHLGILRIHKLAPAVAQYGRINPAYDALTKSAVEVARALSSLRHTQEDVVSFVETTLTMVCPFTPSMHFKVDVYQCTDSYV